MYIPDMSTSAMSSGSTASTCTLACDLASSGLRAVSTNTADSGGGGGWWEIEREAEEVRLLGARVVHGVERMAERGNT